MAIFTPTFRGHRPCTALRGTPPPKVGAFSLHMLGDNLDFLFFSVPVVRQYGQKDTIMHLQPYSA